MKINLLTKFLGIGGTVLIWFPIFASIVTGIIGSIMSRQVLFDFLMPAELAFFAILGGIMLIWAAIRAKIKIKPMVWLLILLIVMLFGSQGIAVASGIASGERSGTGWMFYLIIGMLGVYTFFLIILGILGILTVKAISKQKI